MMMKSATKVAPPNTAAGYEAERLKHASIKDQVAAEITALKDGEPAAALRGELAAHRQKLNDKQNEYDQAAFAEEDAAQRRDEALERERNAALMARKKQAEDAGAKLAAEIAEQYPKACKTILDLLTRERALDVEYDEINKLLPAGVAPLAKIEVGLRHEADIPAEFKTRATQMSGAGRAHVVHAPEGMRGAQPQQDTQVLLVNPGRGAFRPLPLYHTFAAPGLKRDDEPYIVPGSRAARWWK